MQTKTIKLNIYETTTIDSVKRDLCDVLHCVIPLDQLQLSIEGRQLEDGSGLLSDYGIYDQCTLDLKLRGGKCGHLNLL